MTTLSVPLNKNLEEIVNSFVRRGFAPNKAEVMRKALIFLAEEEAVQDVLRAEKEPVLRGDLRELMKKI
jgi:Arc/MetJ-type ribon-helix-helix transcriptional regulator